jgi:hypothetical protein
MIRGVLNLLVSSTLYKAFYFGAFRLICCIFMNVTRSILDRTETRTGVHMPRALGRRDEYIWYGCAKYLWVLSIEQGLCHILGAYNFRFMQGF